MKTKKDKQSESFRCVFFHGLALWIQVRIYAFGKIYFLNVLNAIHITAVLIERHVKENRF